MDLCSAMLRVPGVCKPRFERERPLLQLLLEAGLVTLTGAVRHCCPRSHPRLPDHHGGGCRQAGLHRPHHPAGEQRAVRREIRVQDHDGETPPLQGFVETVPSFAGRSPAPALAATNTQWRFATPETAATRRMNFRRNFPPDLTAQDDDGADEVLSLLRCSTLFVCLRSRTSADHLARKHPVHTACHADRALGSCFVRMASAKWKA